MAAVGSFNEGWAGLVEPGTTLLQAALDPGVNISHGICFTCRVEVVVGPANLTPINPQEVAYDMGACRRLGCQARVLGDVGVRVLTVPMVDLY